MELPGYAGSACIGLAASEGERVIPLSEDGISVLGDHAQVATLQLKVNLLAGAGFKVNTLETA